MRHLFDSYLCYFLLVNIYIDIVFFTCINDIVKS